MRLSVSWSMSVLPFTFAMQVGWRNKPRALSCVHSFSNPLCTSFYVCHAGGVKDKARALSRVCPFPDPWCTTSFYVCHAGGVKDEPRALSRVCPFLIHDVLPFMFAMQVGWQDKPRAGAKVLPFFAHEVPLAGKPVVSISLHPENLANKVLSRHIARGISDVARLRGVGWQLEGWLIVIGIWWLSLLVGPVGRNNK